MRMLFLVGVSKDGCLCSAITLRDAVAVKRCLIAGEKADFMPPRPVLAGVEFGPILCSPHGPMARGSSDIRIGAQSASAVAAATLIQCRDVPRFTSCDVIYMLKHRIIAYAYSWLSAVLSARLGANLV